jgi:hypothetical protein
MPNYKSSMYIGQGDDDGFILYEPRTMPHYFTRK